MGITARCITQAKMPVVPNAVTNYYCGGNPHSTASNAAGAFQSVDLWALSHKQISIVEGSSFQSPTPQDITGVCYVAPTIYTCTTLRSYFNNLNFGDFITSGASNPVTACIRLQSLMEEAQTIQLHPHQHQVQLR